MFPLILQIRGFPYFSLSSCALQSFSLSQPFSAVSVFPLILLIRRFPYFSFSSCALQSFSIARSSFGIFGYCGSISSSAFRTASDTR